MKILLAVDGSPYTKRMLAYLAAYPELIGPSGGYTALAVVPPLPVPSYALLPPGTYRAYCEEQAEAVLKPVRAFAAQQGWRFEERFEVGQPGDAIAAFSEAGRFDLLVMGSHGHGALAGVVMGSVVTRVLARCKTPVLIIR